MAATTSEIVSRRLREMADASRNERSAMSRGVDMTPSAVTMRLQEMSEISRLCARLVQLGKQL